MYVNCLFSNICLIETLNTFHATSSFGVKFNPARPDWLKNPHTGRNMELDCYNEKLGIAVEYNGRQHYEYSPHFHHNDPMEFQEQRQRDSVSMFMSTRIHHTGEHGSRRREKSNQTCLLPFHR